MEQHYAKKILDHTANSLVATRGGRRYQIFETAIATSATLAG